MAAVADRIRLVLRLLAATFAFLLYVWFAAVRRRGEAPAARRALAAAAPSAQTPPPAQAACTIWAAWNAGRAG